LVQNGAKVEVDNDKLKEELETLHNNRTTLRQRLGLGFPEKSGVRRIADENYDLELSLAVFLQCWISLDCTIFVMVPSWLLSGRGELMLRIREA